MPRLAGLAARPGLWAAALAALLYLPSLGGGFLYDDNRIVLGNRALLEGADLATLLRSDPTRPLLALGFAFNFAWSAERAWSYHLVNLLLHAGNAALAAALFAWMARRVGATDPGRHALVAAALFAATPMAVETVAYVASRSTAQCSLLILAALRAALPAVEGGRRFPTAAVALFCAALATKEEAASLPLYLLLLDGFFGAARPTAARLRLHAPFWLLPAAGLLARRLVTGEWLPAPAVALERYAVTQWGAFPFYWARAWLPLDPALYREHPVAPWPPDLPALVLAALGIGLLAAAFALRQRARAFSFSVLWMAAGLVPSSTLVALQEMVVDHRAYLGGAGAHHALAGVALQRLPAWGAPVLVAGFALRAAHYEWVLRDPVRAWEDATRRVPRSPMAHLNLAQAQEQAGDDAGAQAALRRGLTFAPADPRLWTNLGALHASAGRLEPATAAMRQAVATAPGDPRLRHNLAMLLAATGRGDEARAELERVIAALPELAQPRVDLARLLVAPPAPPDADVSRARELIAQARQLARERADSPEIEAVSARLRELP